MEFDNVTGKIVSDISKDTGIVGYEVERVVAMFFKGIKEEMITDIPVYVRMPFLGVIKPKGEFIKRYGTQTTETDNSGGRLPSLQSRGEVDKGIPNTD